MKRIVLLCCLFAATGNISFAQTTANHTTSTTNTSATKSDASANAAVANPSRPVTHKDMFISKAREVDAAITRNNDAAVHGTIYKAIYMMEQEMGGAPDATKNNNNVTAASTKASKQHQLYNKVKSLSANWNDIATNHAAIVAALQEFANTISN